MKITVYDIIGYIFRHKWFICIFVVMCFVLGGFVIDRQQTYTAQAIIRYMDPDAQNGYTPKGTSLDVYEIISPRVVSEAIKTLGVEDNVEDVRSHCSIEGIVPQSEQAIKEAQEKEGKEYTYFPKDYTISYTVGSEQTGAQARDMVDAILNSYTKYYSDTYLSTYTLPEIEFDTVENKHDYLETVEIINTAVEDCVEYFSNQAESNSSFRSPRTGYSFSDLSAKYSELSTVKLPEIFSDILNAHITKDEEIFLKTYEYKLNNSRVSGEGKERDSKTALNLMNKFVEANKDVPNAYAESRSESTDDDLLNSDIYNAHEVYEDYKKTVEDTTYDDLVDKYVVDGTKAGEYNIDAKYYQMILDIFKTELPAGINQKAVEEEVEEDISQASHQVRELYSITNTFMEDFKRNLLTRHINLITSINIKSDHPTLLYKGIVLIMGLLFGCIAAISYELVKYSQWLSKENKEKHKI